MVCFCVFVVCVFSLCVLCVCAGTPTRESAGTPTRESAGTPTRENAGTPTRESAGTPTRESAGTPTRESAGTPTRESAGTPAREKGREARFTQRALKISMSYHLLISFMIMNCSGAHETILDDRGRAPQLGTLKMSLPKTPSLRTSRLLLLSKTTIPCKVFNNVPWLFIDGVRLEGLRQYVHEISRFVENLPYPVTNQGAHHGWLRGKFSILGFIDAILEVFLVNGLQKECPSVFSYKGKPCPLAVMWCLVWCCAVCCVVV